MMMTPRYQSILRLAGDRPANFPTSRTGGLTLMRTATSTSTSTFIPSAPPARRYITTGPDHKDEDGLPVVTIFTGPQCSLCEEMKLELVSVREKQPFHLKTYNIHDRSLPDQPIWQKRYIFDIPVLHVGAEEVLRHRITEKGKGRLVQALVAAAAAAGGSGGEGEGER